MSKNLKALQQALNTSTQRPKPQRATSRSSAAEALPTPANTDPVVTTEPPAPVAASARPAPTSYMAPSREGKTNITAYLSPDFKSSLRLIQARTGKSLQTLIAESLNDLFAKYDVPMVRGD